MNGIQHILIFTLRIYRSLISPVLSGLFGPMGMGCRFTPTCSQYAVEAIQRHGALKGTALTARRLCRCQPWGGCGHDPVPPAAQSHFRISNPTLNEFPVSASPSVLPSAFSRTLSQSND